MNVLKDNWQGQIDGRIHSLKRDFYHPLGKLDFVYFETASDLSYHEAMAQEFKPMEPGKPLGSAYGHVWVRTYFTLPEEAKGRRVVLKLGFHAEATLYIDGETYGTLRTEHGASMVAEPHHFLVDNYVTRSGEPGRGYEVVAEMYCPPLQHDGQYHAIGMLFPESRAEFEDNTNTIIPEESSFGWWNEDAYQLYMDVHTLRTLLDVLPPSSLRAQEVARGLKEFAKRVDFEQPYNHRIDNYRSLRKSMEPFLSAHNGDTMPYFSAIGNSHLDLAWLWKLSETERKTLRTFSAQLRHMEEYPDYLFIQSQPAAYEMCKRKDPVLFKRLVNAVHRGQWIAEGAMWVEPDVNITSGESLIRQIWYGKQFLKDEFGVESKILWLPDSFGYSASMPQILTGCGVPYMMTAKILWNYNGHEPFTEQFFRWRGNDGSEVTVFIPKTYVCKMEPAGVSELWEERAQREELTEYLMPYGYGDGGGGPCRDDIEILHRMRDLEGIPRVRPESPIDFFERNAAAGQPQRVYAKELYWAAHQATYTSGARVKKTNRMLELLLREAEMWLGLASLQGLAVPYEKLDDSWKSMLLHQFHDILPGSSIGEVYRDTYDAHEKIRKTAVELSSNARKALVEHGDGMVVFNALGCARTVLVQLPERFSTGAVDAQNKPVPVTSLNGQPLAMVELPPCGWTTLQPAGEKAHFQPAIALCTAEGFALENKYLRFIINRDGEVISAVIKETGREFAAGPMNRLKLFRDAPERFDVWDFQPAYEDAPVPIKPTQNCDIVCSGGLVASVHTTHWIGSSLMEQTISLSADARVLSFDTKIVWQETHRLLKVSFPAAVRAETMRNDIQYGYVTRPVNRSTKEEKNIIEVVNHRYTALCDEGGGVAVLNDCKYGISANGNELLLSLMRAPMAPQIDLDKGEHSFRYGLFVWEGAFGESRTAFEAQSFNVPVACTEGEGGMYSALDIDASNVLLDTIKPAFDKSGDLVIRLYESQGRTCRAFVRLNMETREVWLCDMLENRLEPIMVVDHSLRLNLTPFKVVTLRVTARRRKDA